MKATLSLIILMSSVYLSYAQENFENPEVLIRSLYDEVTFNSEESPDWERAKSLFIDEAVIVLRYSKEDIIVFDVQGWVDDFISFIKNNNVQETGIEEKILDMKSFIYGDIASINVLFESHIPGTERRNKGVDIFQLIKKEGNWLIVSIINERPSVAGPLPDIYKY